MCWRLCGKKKERGLWKSTHTAQRLSGRNTLLFSQSHHGWAWLIVSFEKWQGNTAIVKNCACSISPRNEIFPRRDIWDMLYSCWLCQHHTWFTADSLLKNENCWRPKTKRVPSFLKDWQMREKPTISNKKNTLILTLSLTHTQYLKMPWSRHISSHFFTSHLTVNWLLWLGYNRAVSGGSLQVKLNASVWHCMS